jgi:hypothetical protein
MMEKLDRIVTVLAWILIIFAIAYFTWEVVR